ncbi:MAG TPA: NINE protein [Gemmata sp.]|nr:NINE protein [Gemmata sp.]
MAIILICPGCSARLTLDDDRAGSTFDCPTCGTKISVPVSSTSAPKPLASTKFCHECGESIRKRASICPKCGVRQPSVRNPRASYRTDPALRHANGQKLAAGLCGIFLGALGIHKFILGLNQQGITMLLVTVLSCGIAYPVTHIIGIIEGIIYLTKSDEEFYEVYMVEKKEWF